MMTYMEFNDEKGNLCGVITTILPLSLLFLLLLWGYKNEADEVEEGVNIECWT